MVRSVKTKNITHNVNKNNFKEWYMVKCKNINHNVYEKNFKEWYNTTKENCKYKN